MARFFAASLERVVAERGLSHSEYERDVVRRAV
jgi:hypothetical protein